MAHRRPPRRARHPHQDSPFVARRRWDPTGANSRRLLRTLKPGGALFWVYLADFDPEEVERLGATVSATQVRANGRQLEEIAQLIGSGTLRVAIDSTYRLADARQAHERAARGHLQGKIVLDVS